MHPKCIAPLLLLITFTIFLNPAKTKAFSILAHEAVIDAEWDKLLKPTLLARYPSATPEELKQAHAYAYGGCLVPDMGYMPFGDPFFTDLLHYVRSGDFVTELINDAQNLDQYAFALGALSHYMADKYGHSLATNQTVPLLYPKLKSKYGSVVTYDDNHMAHSRVEFGFDVVQIAKGNYASTAYHDFIGFSIDSALLARAFYNVYGETLPTVFPSFKSTVSTFRWGVRDLFPALTRMAWHIRRDTIHKFNQAITRNKFKYRMNRRMFKKEFGSDYKQPDFSARLIVFVIRILPKIGPLKKLKFQDPGPQGEKLFYASIDSILFNFSAAVNSLQQTRQTFKNIDYDTGNPTTLSEYQLTDETYQEWLLTLQDKKFANLNQGIKDNIITFYSHLDTSRQNVENPKGYKKVMEALNVLRTTPPVN